MKHNFIFSKKIIFWHLNTGIQNFPWQKNKTMYKVWLSEIMLQQTQVITVITYYKKFINRFPTIFQLAESELNEVLYLWSGLGYYNRAINLHKTAKIIVEIYSGKFPQDFNILISFPGIGKSTAGAILSLALNKRYPILDSNVKRILIRFYLLNISETTQSATTKKLWNLIEKLTPYKNISIFNQAIMNLGRLICTYKKPICHICPINENCQFFLTKAIEKNQNFICIKTTKKLNRKIWWLLLISQKNKTIWLIQRSTKKIWKNLFCFPEFENYDTLNKYVTQHDLYDYTYHNINTLKYQISNINLEIQPILIIIKQTIRLIDDNGIWYCLHEPPPLVGLPKPVLTLLNKIKFYLNL